MNNKKAQGMPMNVIIVAIIVLVVLVILIAFFAGGFGSVTSKVRDLFTGQVSGQARDTVLQTCQNQCDVARGLPQGTIKNSGYCTNSYVVDIDNNPDTVPVRMTCGSVSKQPSPTIEDNKKSITFGGNLGIDCPEITSCT